MKIRFLLLVTLMYTLTLLPVSAHEQGAAGHDPSGPAGSVSIHQKIDQFLKAAPANHSFTVAWASKTAGDFLLDVRTAASLQKSPVTEAVNIPLADLHGQLQDLPKDKRVLVIGDSTADSAYAVFVLRLHGIDGWLVKNREAASGCPMAGTDTQ